MDWWRRRTGRKTDNPAAALYNAVVAVGRAPHWYEAGAVPDTVNGRFDAIATVLAIVLLRLEGEPTGAETTARLIECFVDDMDGQLRQIGIGDVVVGKRMGKIMGMVGGRLGAYRAGLAGEASFEEALVRNLYRGESPPEAALAHSANNLHTWHRELAGTPLDALLIGRLPQ